MSGNHIDFSELEPGEPVDRNHLESCKVCRRQWKLLSFLRFQASQAPQIEAPPFFASRVARLAAKSSVPLWYFVDRIARWVVPAMATAVLVMSIVFVATRTEPLPTDEYSELLIESPAPDELSFEDLIVQTSETLGETK